MGICAEPSPLPSHHIIFCFQNSQDLQIPTTQASRHHPMLILSQVLFLSTEDTAVLLVLLDSQIVDAYPRSMAGRSRDWQGNSDRGIKNTSKPRLSHWCRCRQLPQGYAAMSVPLTLACSRSALLASQCHLRDDVAVMLATEKGIFSCLKKQIRMS